MRGRMNIVVRFSFVFPKIHACSNLLSAAYQHIPYWVIVIALYVGNRIRYSGRFEYHMATTHPYTLDHKLTKPKNLWECPEPERLALPWVINTPMCVHANKFIILRVLRLYVNSAVLWSDVSGLGDVLSFQGTAELWDEIYVDVHHAIFAKFNT